ncbi:MAG TPA: hypothetical protein VFW73_00890 [Lacipirellulaceae bacterium]|nr:hypothetical protein [Lacipirellulaceae bacterium]
MSDDRSTIQGFPCAKGAVCYCLDEFSKGRGARSRVNKLNDAIASIAPSYAGLEDVFDEHLLSRVIPDSEQRKRKVVQLRDLWFGPDPSASFYPGKPVVQIYAEGVRKTLELSLKGRRGVVPINAWWVLDCAEFRMLTLADVDEQGVTVGGRVTLLIMTPQPRYKGRPIGGPPILGTAAQAWVTEERRGHVATRPVRDIR